MSNRSLNSMRRAGFAMANSMRNWHSCLVNIAEQSIAEEEALKNGMEEKSSAYEI